MAPNAIYRRCWMQHLVSYRPVLLVLLSGALSAGAGGLLLYGAPHWHLLQQFSWLPAFFGALLIIRSAFAVAVGIDTLEIACAASSATNRARVRAIVAHVEQLDDSKPGQLAPSDSPQAALPSAPLVPDSSDPITAIRCWEVSLVDGIPALASVSANSVWPSKKAMSASCHRHGLLGGEHGSTEDVPKDGCSCGIYAARMTEPKSAFRYFRGGVVIGTVSLWGKLIEGEKGYRAEFGYPQHLYLLKGVEYRAGDAYLDAGSLAQCLNLRYGVPVDVINSREFAGIIRRLRGA